LAKPRGQSRSIAATKQCSALAERAPCCGATANRLCP
jgi:hypothetical protein